MQPPKQHGFTLIELLVVISIITLLIGILLPALGAARNAARRAQSNANLRSLVQTFHVFSQTNGGYYPGLDRSGELIDNPEDWVPDEHHTGGTGANAGARMGIIVLQGYMDPEAVRSPFDDHGSMWQTGEFTGQPGVPDGAGNPGPHYSYAILHLHGLDDEDNDDYVYLADRAREWQDTASTSAIIAADRGIGSDDNPRSIQTRRGWAGGVVRNDVSVSQHNAHHGLSAQLGNSSRYSNDNLFEEEEGAGDSEGPTMLVFGGADSSNRWNSD